MSIMDIVIVKSTRSHPDGMMRVDFLFLPEVKKSGGSLHRPILIMKIAP